MNSHHNGSNLEKDPLEQAKDALQQAEKELTTAVHNADSAIQRLIFAKVEALERLQAATKRHEAVKQATSRLCHDCCKVLPVLVGTKLGPEDFGRNAPNCAFCNQPLGYIPSAIEMPPSDAWSLDRAVSSLRGAEKVIEGKSTSYKSDHGEKSRKQWSHEKWQKGPVVTPYVPTSSLHRMRTKPPSPKHEVCEEYKFLNLAKKSEEEAKDHLSEVSHAMENWKKYRKQYKQVLAEVKASHLSIQDRARKILQDKLAKLGGASPPTNYQHCSICMERPKEVVFQCGHQSCTQCSSRLTQCHTCRESIQQRIKLYD